MSLDHRLQTFQSRGSILSQSYAVDAVRRLFVVIVCCGIMLSTVRFGLAQEAAKTDGAGKANEAKWISLLPTDDLDDWNITNFGGEGSVEIKTGTLSLGRGDPLTGIHWKKKDFPRDQFEMRWKARRVDGSDFFAGVTFPIGKEYCSFICGGWGGGLVGVSCINGNDASENETASFKDFKNGRWYSFLVRLDKKHLKVLIDDEEVVSVEREGKEFSLRAEVIGCKPLGYCAFQSVCEIKDWEYRPLSQESK